MDSCDSNCFNLQSGAVMAVLAAICSKMPEAKLGIIFLPMVTFTAGTVSAAHFIFPTYTHWTLYEVHLTSARLESILPSEMPTFFMALIQHGDYSQLIVMFKKLVRDDLTFVTWCVIPLEAAIRRPAHCSHKHMNMISSNTQAGCCV